MGLVTSHTETSMSCEEKAEAFIEVFKDAIEEEYKPSFPHERFYAEYDPNENEVFFYVSMKDREGVIDLKMEGINPYSPSRDRDTLVGWTSDIFPKMEEGEIIRRLKEKELLPRTYGEDEDVLWKFHQRAVGTLRRSQLRQRRLIGTLLYDLNREVENGKSPEKARDEVLSALDLLVEEAQDVREAYEAALDRD